MTVRLDEMSWPEIKEVLGKPNAVVLPMGSTEEHGAHLPVNIDTFAATYIAEHAAQKVVDEHKICVLVAPTINYTEVSHHKRFPGTIGVKADTLIKMLTDIVGSFLHQGFKNIIALTSHSENVPPLQVAFTMLADDHPEANLIALNTVGLGAEERLKLLKAGIAGMGHALEVETNYALVMQPQNVHLDRAIIGSRKLPLSEKYVGSTGSDKGKGVSYCSGITGFEESGTFGDPTKATKEAGEKMLSIIISDLADIIVQAVKKDEVS